MSLIIVCSTGNIKARVAIPQSAWAFWETPGHDWRLQLQSPMTTHVTNSIFLPLNPYMSNKWLNLGGGGEGMPGFDLCKCS